AQAFERHIGDGPADQRARYESDRSDPQPDLDPGAALATAHQRNEKNQRGERHAGGRLPTPVRMVGDGLAPAALGLPAIGGVTPPVPPPRRPGRAFPRLVISFDQVDAVMLALGEREHILDGARLVHRRWQGALAHAARARPAELADEYLLAGKGGHHPPAD